jgi:hypothetical protein
VDFNEEIRRNNFSRILGVSRWNIKMGFVLARLSWHLFSASRPKSSALIDLLELTQFRKSRLKPMRFSWQLGLQFSKIGTRFKTVLIEEASLIKVSKTLDLFYMAKNVPTTDPQVVHENLSDRNRF